MKKTLQIVSIALLALILQGCTFISHTCFLFEFLFSELSESSIQNYKRIISEAGHDSLGFPEIPKDAVWRGFKLSNPKDSSDYQLIVSVNFTRFGGVYGKEYTFVFNKNKNLIEEEYEFNIFTYAHLFDDDINRTINLSYDYRTKKAKYELWKTKPLTKKEHNFPNYSEYYNERYKREEISLEEANKLIAEWDELIRISEEKKKEEK